ncbi:acetyltransferase [Salinisphaera sp. Q1T1-3]|uniref:acetyltransferase n=1 Tax=Salinisphaera sp. Q1T1-3 TaxID=2321229 RepID=UPI000E729BF5|nr:acetyltransferase [Salinisphaera sp. Q1T1-3]RJS94287.1 acyltransferase [Salinisphaera sp. Q1T1-3]
MHRLVGYLRGALIVFSVVVATLVGAVPLIPAAVAKIALPPGRARRLASRVVYAVATSWARTANRLILGLSGTRIDYHQGMTDDPDGRYVLISNHQSWADIMLLIAAIDPQLPFPRFFIKEQLRWLPVIGLACWALDFPFMKRHSRAAIQADPARRHEDMRTIQRACAVFRDVPVSLVNYAEGTRSTPAKRAAVDSPYATMLPPKAGGTAFAVNAMSGVLDGILDMTLAYVDTPVPSFWNLLCGRIPSIAIRVRYLPLPEALANGDYGADATYRDRFKTWLNELWAAKDTAVARLQDPNDPARRFDDLSGPTTARD